MVQVKVNFCSLEFNERCVWGLFQTSNFYRTKFLLNMTKYERFRRWFQTLNLIACSTQPSILASNHLDHAGPCDSAMICSFSIFWLFFLKVPKVKASKRWEKITEKERKFSVCLSKLGDVRWHDHFHGAWSTGVFDQLKLPLFCSWSMHGRYWGVKSKAPTCRHSCRWFVWN